MPYTIIDTYSFFKKSWERVGKEVSKERVVECWEKEYMSKYPELLKLQVECYEDLGVDWRKIAREKVFPKIPNALQAMEKARDRLYKAIPKAYRKFSNFWKCDLDVVFVIYVGLGCGAGWATEYHGHYAVLLGLENIAELGWINMESLEGLLLHELSHIVHMVLRGVRPKEFEKLEEDPLFLLYSEGFATRCEHLMLGEEKWRIAPDKSWLEWCRENLSFLASEYLRRVNQGEQVNDFFGSWLNIEGRSQTGYYLGHELIRFLENKMGIEEIASMSLKDVRKNAKEFLTVKSRLY